MIKETLIAAAILAATPAMATMPYLVPDPPKRTSAACHKWAIDNTTPGNRFELGGGRVGGGVIDVDDIVYIWGRDTTSGKPSITLTRKRLFNRCMNPDYSKYKDPWPVGWGESVGVNMSICEHHPKWPPCKEHVPPD